MPAARQLTAQLPEIVDLAVTDEPERPVLVGDGLMPALDVDDGQAPHPEQHLPVEMKAVVVRSPVDGDVAHPTMHVLVGTRSLGEGNESVDTAHEVDSALAAGCGGSVGGKLREPDGTGGFVHVLTSPDDVSAAAADTARGMQRTDYTTCHGLPFVT